MAVACATLKARSALFSIFVNAAEVCCVAAALLLRATVNLVHRDRDLPGCA